MTDLTNATIPLGIGDRNRIEAVLEHARKALSDGRFWVESSEDLETIDQAIEAIDRLLP